MYDFIHIYVSIHGTHTVAICVYVSMHKGYSTWYRREVRVRLAAGPGCGIG